VRAKRGASGTRIVVRKLKVFYPRLPALVRQDLQRRFSPFLRSGELEIRVNGRPCELEEIRLLPGSRREFRVRMRGGEPIRGWYGLLAEGSTKGYYGFHTYRRNRMITTFDKIAIGEEPTLSRITGEIHLDPVPVTHNKREFIRESRAYREAVGLLQHEFRGLVREARRQARLDTVTPTVVREVKSWTRKIAEAVNSEEFLRYAARFRLLAAAVGVRGNGARGGRSRKGAKPAARAKLALKLHGRSVPFKHHFAPLGSRAGRRQSTLSRRFGLEIFTNTDFPAYATTKDKVFYAVLNLADTIAEHIVRESREDVARMEEIKDLILRKAAELKLALDH
jgi:hypothetical protein